MKKAVLSIGMTLLMSLAGSAQNPGDLDSSFGIGGYSMSDPFVNTGEVYLDLISLSDDKIVKVGYADDGNDKDILVGKFKANGVPDSTFAADGFIKIDLSLGGNEEAHSVYELAGGDLLITGYVQTISSLDGFILKLFADGTTDVSFGYYSGYTPFNVADSLICTGEAITYNGSEIFVGATALVGGQVDIALINFNQDGTIDSSFATDGIALMDIDGGNDVINAMDMKSNGAFVFGGKADSSGVQIGYVASLSQFGTPTTFGNSGVYRFDIGSGENVVTDLYVDSNDKIVLTGSEGIAPDVNGIVQRLTPTGQLDGTFAINGMMASDPGATTALYFTSVGESPDGAIIATGHFEGASKELYAMALNSDGSLHSNFGGNGDVIVPLTISTNTLTSTAGAIQSDGSIIIGGYLTSQDFVGENMFMIRLQSTIQGAAIEEIYQEDIIVYPNPATEFFTVDVNDVQAVELISMSGQIVRRWNAQSTYQVPQGLTEGTYLLKVTTTYGVGITKLIIR